MDRCCTPAVEVLEGKQLLSAGGRLRRESAVAPAQVAPPANPALKIVLTTDHHDYHKGEPVVMTLTVTNTSAQNASLPLGPSTDGFYVTQNGREVWASNTGPQPLFIVLRTLTPGESLTLSATWNGHSNIGPPSVPTGSLVVHSQVPGAAPVTIQVASS